MTHPSPEEARRARIDRAFAEIHQCLEAHPGLAERTRDYLARCHQREESRMSQTARSIRISDDTWNLAQRMALHLAEQPELALHGKVTRSKVLRVALHKGLEVLQAAYGEPPPLPAKSKAKAKRKRPK